MALRAWQPATGDTIGGCLVSVAEVKLGENAFHVVFDRVLTNHQMLGDLGVGEARSRQLQHLHLSGSELVLGSQGLILALTLSPNLFQDSGSYATRDRSLAPRQAPQLLQELPGPHILDQVALRSRLD